MKFGFILLAVAALALVVIAGCSKGTPEQGASFTTPATATDVSDADLSSGVDDLSDLEDMSAENDAMFDDSSLDQMTLQ